MSWTFGMCTSEQLPQDLTSW